MSNEARNAESFFTRSGLHRELERTLSRDLASEALAGLDRIAFFMIKRDALVADKARAILAFLAHAGLDVLWAGVSHDCTVREFEELYKFNLTLANSQNMVSAWWLNAEPYTQGPVLDLLVFARTGDEPLYPQLGELKGPSNPFDCRPGQLRYELLACNRSLSLVHSADDPLSSAREFLIFHPREELYRSLDLLPRLSDEPTAAAHRTGMAERIELLLGSCPAATAEVDVVAVLARVKLRLLTVLEGRLERRLRVQLAMCHRRLLDLGAGLEGSPHARAHELREILDAERALLPATAGWEAREELRLLRDLADLDTFDFALAEQLERALGQHGILLDEWERLVLRSSLFYADDLRAGARSAGPASYSQSAEPAA